MYVAHGLNCEAASEGRGHESVFGDLARPASEPLRHAELPKSSDICSDRLDPDPYHLHRAVYFCFRNHHRPSAKASKFFSIELFMSPLKLVSLAWEK